MENYIVLFWVLLGVILFVIEFINPHFGLFFLGIGAWVTAIAKWFGLVDSLPLQLLVFALVSILTLLLFRKKWKSVFVGKISGKAGDNELNEIKGEKAVVVTEIIPNQVGGKVEYNGTNWNAESDVQIEKGKVVIITDRVNLILKVKPL